MINQTELNELKESFIQLILKAIDLLSIMGINNLADFEAVNSKKFDFTEVDALLVKAKEVSLKIKQISTKELEK